VSLTTEPLVRILLAIDAQSVFNELTPGFVRRKRMFDRARGMSRLRRAKRWADVTLIRPFQRVTLALFACGRSEPSRSPTRQQFIDKLGRTIQQGHRPAGRGRTTFEAVTHALMTTALTDHTAASLGDVLALVDRWTH